MTDYAITVTFAADDAAPLEAKIRQIAAATGCDYLTSAGIPPHVSIGAFATGDEAGLTRRVGEFASGSTQGELRFIGVGSFGDAVVFAAPEKCGWLKEANRALCEKLAGLTPAEGGYYMPQIWRPHCTLAARTDAEGAGIARRLAGELQFPFTVRAVSVTLAVCAPYKEIRSWSIGG